VTFDGPMSTYRPFDLVSSSRVLIAPFFDDVDTRGSGSVTYGTTTYLGRDAFCANWIDVGYYSYHTDKLNSFQLLLVDRSNVAPGDFDIIFNYDKIDWEATDTATVATVGYSPGPTAPAGSAFQFPGSGVTDALLDSNPVTGLSGTYVMSVRNGDPGEITVDPSAPRNLTATPGNKKVTIGWAAPSDDGGATISDYVIQYRRKGTTAWATFADGVSTARHAHVTGLTNGTNYQFRVAAKNSVGVGAWSVIEMRPGVPTQPRLPGALPCNAQATVSWQAPASSNGAAVTDYVIQYRPKGTSAWLTFADGASTALLAEVTGLTNGTTYQFRVAAMNARGTGPWSAVVQAKPAP
jgi:hypothetical protein